ncbi:bile acid:sodium symporter family protein [Olivibacter sp. SDN3]|uniref:bile acid:sodium symporter family protein n=1 Tax=Olivibacter sp. SDN3 TaxID=2764720 RepID=UPI001650EA1C|nr:bile acid:sodium symporter family protein [Olivibacter sp. SDN3]QNL51794.1 bile acid:sodium symporter family protein [Olivibacter sp. SDN3]
MNTIRKVALLTAGVSFVIFLPAVLMGHQQLWQAMAVTSSIAGSIGLGAIPVLQGYQYTAWVISAVVCGMIYPEQLLHIGSVDMRNKWLILFIIQLVMFGMGMKMSIKDFTGIAKSGKGVVVGLLSHFTVMPLMGFLLTKIFHFDMEIAAGIILIGCCSSGLASNVMTYIARGNLVLSVTVTAITTIAAPIMTPFLMKLLAGTLIEVKFIYMMMEIIKIVIVPLSAALIHDFLKTASLHQAKRVNNIMLFALLWLLVNLLIWNKVFYPNLSLPLLETLEVCNFFAGAIVIGVLYHLLAKRTPKIGDFMPYLSMAGIVYFTMVTTAAGRDNLLQVGFLLFLAAVIHNGAGYFFGYTFSRLLGLNKADARTLAFEVGLQNGGMATGLAGTMGKLETVGLAAAIFSPWMNISGSILANYWRKKEEKVKKQQQNHKSLMKSELI